jgi:hypothetical protein
MADVRNDRQDTILLGLIIIGGALIFIATYFLQIVLFIGALLLGAGIGFLISVALGHTGKRWGYAGFLELIVVTVSFRFLFGSPFSFDPWRGAFAYFNVVAPVSSGFRSTLWIVVAVTTVVATGVWSALNERSDWDDSSEKVQNGATQAWSEIIELFFWAPRSLATRFFDDRALATYGVIAVVMVGLGGLGFYYRATSMMTFEVVLNAAILLGALALFRESLLNAATQEIFRTETMTSQRLARIEANRIEQQAKEERRRLEADNQAREQEKRRLEYAKARKIAQDKERLLKEAIEDARPGQGKRTDLTPINEIDLGEDDLF